MESGTDELFVHVEQGNNGDIIELLAAFEKRNFDNEKVAS